MKKSVFAKALLIALSTAGALDNSGMSLGNALLAQSREDRLRESVVTAEMTPRALVKSAARKFSEDYWRNYVSEIMAVRSVKSEGRYRNIQAGVGIFLSANFTQKAEKFYWDDPNRLDDIGFADSFVSETMYPWGNEVNTLLYVAGGNGPSQFSIGYNDSFDLSALEKKRSLELWSPLNPKRISQYDYEYDKTAQDTAIVVFHTKQGVTWKDNRIRCPEGKIYIDNAGDIIRMDVRNMEDRYSTYIRNFSEKSRIVTPYVLSVTYSRRDGKIYMESIAQHLEWNGEPSDNETLMYAAEKNSFRQPFKYRLTTDIRIDFRYPTDVAAEERSALNRILMAWNYWRETSDFGWWHKKLAEYVDLPKLLNDMGIDWTQLCEFTMTRQARFFDDMLANRANYSGNVSEEAIARMKDLHKTCRTVFRQMFGRNYNED